MIWNNGPHTKLLRLHDLCVDKWNKWSRSGETEKDRGRERELEKDREKELERVKRLTSRKLFF